MLGDIGSKKLLDSCRKVVIASETAETATGMSIRKAQAAFKEITDNDPAKTNSVLFQLASDKL